MDWFITKTTAVYELCDDSDRGRLKICIHVVIYSAWSRSHNTETPSFLALFVHKEKSFPVQFFDHFWITCGLDIVRKVLECVQSSLLSDNMENKCMCSHKGKKQLGVWYFLGVYKSIHYWPVLKSQCISEKYSKNSTVACSHQSLWCRICKQCVYINVVAYCIVRYWN